MPKLIDLTGRIFGRLTAESHIAGSYKWKCRCTCGAHCTPTSRNLITGNSTSCGCLRSEQISARFRKHGATSGGETVEYQTWKRMIQRCHGSSNRRDWKHYGGRGIKVCDRWRNDATAFLADMGPRPSNRHSIDRIDDDGDYSPENCRWATVEEQRRNYKRNVNLTYQDRTMCATDWGKEVGLPAAVILDRVRRGWPVEKILCIPKMSASSRRRNRDGTFPEGHGT